MMITLTILCLVLLLASMLLTIFSKSPAIKGASKAVSFYLVFLFSILLMNTVRYYVEDKTYIKALKYNPYEMEVLYKSVDSTMIPTDTLYILKKK